MEELATGYGLIEGPVWDAARQCLYYSDVPNGGVFRLDADGAVSVQFPHRRGIGGMALHEAGGLVVGGRNLAFKSFAGGPSQVLLDNDVTEHAIGFNDFTTDPQGRLWAGSLAFRVFGGEEPRPGHLHRVDLDGSAHTLSDGVMLTNGMGFSPDGARLYHSDARAELIRVYDVDEAGGASPWRVFARIPGDVPDGLAVAADGTVWVALAHGGRVAVFSPEGEELRSIPVPLPMVTSVCFGGADLRDLYIVTGSRGGPHKNCGAVFRTRVETPGLPLADCRVRLPE